MSAPIETPTRLAGAAAGDATERRAAELLRVLQAPPARLPPSARARIATALDERAARAQAPRRVRWTVAVAAALVLLVGISVGGAVGAAGGLAPARRWLGRWLAPAARVVATRHVAGPHPDPLPQAGEGARKEGPRLDPVPSAEEAPHPDPGSRAGEGDGRVRARAVRARVAPVEDPIVAESRVLASALQELRQRRDPRAALAALDDYERRFPAGTLAPEATAARIDALLALGRRGQALERLEAVSLERLPRSAELRALRGELRAGRGQLGAALDDFSAVLALPGAPPGVVERALYGRGSCRSRLGDVAGARADLNEVLRRFPNGPFAEPARRALRD